MGRRALSRKIKRVPPSPEAEALYVRLWIQEELHFHPERFPKLTSPELFGDTRPLELEVGCGTGEYLCALAAARPDVNFLGIDPVTKVLYFAARRAEELGLKNLRLLRSPIQVLFPLLAPDSLSAVYVHFPDPFVRSRGQHKVLNALFFEAIQRALAPGKVLNVVSDKAELFEEALRLALRQAGLERTHTERHLVGFEPEVKSRYQLKWERYELPALRFEMRKVPLLSKVGS
ncbi:MAG: methyltransferase domain-containing protein [Deltaproteobacteria bacterium]|nr:methyltransferase domain-containing protein [Deltaproteobacteria bacterium]